MIKIVKPQSIPPILHNKGMQKSQELCISFTQNSNDYINGSRQFDFDNKIYGAKSVKNLLQKAQYCKCAFCETDIGSGSYGDIEHFRPKRGYQQSSRSKFQRPGYYWLVYDWDNLLLSCSVCNQSFKKNLFPLADHRRRARTHRDDINIEDPIFINPTKEDPANYISFNKEIAFSINNNKKGKETIKGFGLNRPKLTTARRKYYEKLKLSYELLKSTQVNMPDSLRIKFQTEIDDAIEDHAPYAAMIRAAIKNNFTI